ncbi:MULTISPECIES: c-type cytochrome [unclassified Roseitalea]|uniref:c-type cytochrome n=1 Tax=unclassified Roseitalea TaxID=2639107 RepID=UPI00273E2AEC|nr:MULTISPECIES: c-type cytochrome [unclassified Roseitalea]
MTILIRTLIATAASAAIGLVVVAEAQNFQDAPSVQSLEARLDNDARLFGAAVDVEVDDDLLEAGRLVAMGGAENGGSGMACITCHGAQGEGDGSGAFPRLTSLPAWYMYKQLIDYASGDRPNRVMSRIASRLTEYEMEAVSAYYSVLRSPREPVIGEVDGELLQWGAQLGAVGSAERGIPACVNCHGPNGSGLAPSVPYLAGQYARYMEYQLQLWKEGVRDNDPLNVMSTIAQKMTEYDMRAVSEYYARVRAERIQDDGVAVVPE